MTISDDEGEIRQVIADALECAAIEAMTEIEELIIGKPGLDGEHPLRKWKPLGILGTFKFELDKGE